MRPMTARCCGAVPLWGPEIHLGRIQLAQSGTYRVTVTASEPTAYELMMNRRETPLLAPGVKDHFTEHVQTMDFFYEAEAGEERIFTVDTEYFDAVLTLYDPDGNEIASDDDSGGNLNALIGPVTLDEGRYRLVVQRYANQGDSIFYVAARHNPLSQPNMIAYGDSREIVLDAERHTQTFRFQGKAGEVVALTINDPDEVAFFEISNNSRRLASTDLERRGTILEHRAHRFTGRRHLPATGTATGS